MSLDLVRAIAVADLAVGRGWTEPIRPNPMPFGLLYHPTWMMRSRPPMSTPSSNVDVATTVGCLSLLRSASASLLTVPDRDP